MFVFPPIDPNIIFNHMYDINLQIVSFKFSSHVPDKKVPKKELSFLFLSDELQLFSKLLLHVIY